MSTVYRKAANMKNVILRNSANILTGIRIIATLLLCCQINLLPGETIGLFGYIWVVILFLIVWISDIADGKIARKLKISSTFGAKFDVIADSTFVFMLHILLAILHIVPIWFIAFMAEKIVNYIVSSYVVSKKSNGKFDFIRDPLGRVISASYFITPFLLLATHMIDGTLYSVAIVIIAVIAALGIASSVYRIVNMLKLISFGANI